MTHKDYMEESGGRPPPAWVRRGTSTTPAGGDMRYEPATVEREAALLRQKAREERKSKTCGIHGSGDARSIPSTPSAAEAKKSKESVEAGATDAQKSGEAKTNEVHKSFGP